MRERCGATFKHHTGKRMVCNLPKDHVGQHGVSALPELSNWRSRWVPEVGDRGERDPRMMRDLLEAAEDFVEAISEYADPIFHEEDKEELAMALRARALVVLKNPSANWSHDG